MKFAEECGIFGGIAKDTNIAPIIKSGLIALQHRGEQSTGLCCFGNDTYILKGEGRADSFFTQNPVDSIISNIGIGHVRYSTSNDVSQASIQPFCKTYSGYNIAFAHNGHINLTKSHKDFLYNNKVTLESQSDSEALFKFILQQLKNHNQPPTFENIGEILYTNFNNSAWCIIIACNDKIFGFRDSNGYRPLVLGQATDGIFLASEDCAFKKLTLENITEIQPGQGVEINKDSYTIRDFHILNTHKQCVFEQIYFAKSDSNIFGLKVAQSRIELGKICAIENPIDADIVVPILNSGYYSAVGYSEYSKIPLHKAIDTDKNAQRSFIQNEQGKRTEKVLQKLKINKNEIKGKKVVVVDDSIVRGTTAIEVANILRNAEAKEIHFRLSSPKIINTCSWGVDIPTKEELLAFNYKSNAELCNYIGIDSIGFISTEGLHKVFDLNRFCTNCLKGDCKITTRLNSLKLEASR